jgi:H+/Cl- antiporter ClcA
LVSNNALKILLLVVVFGLALIIAVMGVVYRNALKLQGIFLDYARRLLAERFSTFAYIPIFIILTAIAFALFLFQHLAFTSKAHSNNNYFDFSNPGVLGWLNIIEFLWILQFFRDSCKH